MITQFGVAVLVDGQVEVGVVLGVEDSLDVDAQAV